MHKLVALTIAAIAVVAALVLGFQPVQAQGFDATFGCGSAFWPSNTAAEKAATSYANLNATDLAITEESYGLDSSGVVAETRRAAKHNASVDCARARAATRYPAISVLVGGLVVAGVVGGGGGLMDRRRRADGSESVPSEARSA